jgi:hypothetical protein
MRKGNEKGCGSILTFDSAFGKVSEGILQLARVGVPIIAERLDATYPYENPSSPVTAFTG